MRGYYYDQTGEAPRSTPAPISAGRRRRWSGAAAVLLFLLTMALLGGLGKQLLRLGRVGIQPVETEEIAFSQFLLGTGVVLLGLLLQGLKIQGGVGLIGKRRRAQIGFTALPGQVFFKVFFRTDH